jgi:LacI family transcriptional regulator
MLNADPARRATLQEVADRAGVSIATASRALNGAIAAPASVERVRAAAAELNYIPNGAARSLRSERTMTIGLAIFSLRLPGALDMLGSLSRSLDGHGYTLLIADTGGDRSRFDVILERFLERRVDALLCVNPDGVGPILNRYREVGIPVAAVMSRGRGTSWLPLFAPALEPAVSQAVSHLETLGHQRVCAMLPGGEAGPFRAALRRLRGSGMEVATVNPFEPDFSVAQVVEGFRESVTTAVVTSFPLALETLHACRRHGVSVPGDLSVVSIGEESGVAELLDMPISAVTVDLAAFGRQVGEAIVACISGETPDRNELFPVAKWVERSTTGTANGLASTDEVGHSDLR